MKIPESIRIGGVEYEIEREDNLRHGDKLCYGKISFEEDKIWLSGSDGTGHQRQCITLWHEILHGLLCHACLGLDEEEEEEIVEVLSKGIYQVLQDNGRNLFDLRDTEEEALRSELYEKLERLGGLMDKLEKDFGLESGEDCNECI